MRETLFASALVLSTACVSSTDKQDGNSDKQEGHSDKQEGHSDKQEKQEGHSDKQEEPAAAKAGEAPKAQAEPAADVIYALVAGSSLPLEVVPAATLGQHYTQSTKSNGAPTSVSCEPSNNGGYECSVWFKEDAGFFYSVTLVQEDSSWRIDSAEVMSDD